MKHQIRKDGREAEDQAGEPVLNSSNPLVLASRGSLGSHYFKLRLVPALIEVQFLQLERALAPVILV